MINRLKMYLNVPDCRNRSSLELILSGRCWYLPKCCNESFTGTNLCNPDGENASFVTLSMSELTIGSYNRILRLYIVQTSRTMDSTMSISNCVDLLLLPSLPPWKMISPSRKAKLSFRMSCLDIRNDCCFIVGLCASNMRALSVLMMARTQPNAIFLTNKHI